MVRRKYSPAGLPLGEGSIMEAVGNDEARALALQRLLLALLDFEERGGDADALVDATIALIAPTPDRTA